MKLSGREVGSGEPCYTVAEIGANHGGSLDLALTMIRAAHAAGADAVKTQKRDVDVCIPPEQADIVRDSPFGLLTYREYRRRLEFGASEYDEIDAECRRLGISWLASAWDEPSVEFLSRYDTPAIKIASASLTDHALLRAARRAGKPVILSTGMSTSEEIDAAVDVLGPRDLVLLHCISAYPAQVEELNLSCITTLQRQYPDIPVGFSGHELGIAMSLAAVVLGAVVIERHFTTDRTLPGTDQSASLEPKGFAAMVRDIRKWEKARGDGIKKVYDSELPIRAKLRRVVTEEGA